MTRDPLRIPPLGSLSRRAFIGSAVAGSALIGCDPRAWAHSYELKGLMIGHLWSPPEQGRDLKVFGPILNRNKAPDWLVAVHAPAESAGFASAAGGKLTALDRIELPPGQPVSLAPWASYIRLTGLRDAAKAGAWVRLTLVFQVAGTIEVKSLVEAKPSD